MIDGLLILHMAAAAVLLLALLQMSLHLLVIPRLRKQCLKAPLWPRVSVLVPARNEARNIGECVRSLLAQDYPNFQLHVLDDHSSDSTAQIVRSLGLNESNGGLLRGEDLPLGWVGKNWACHQLSRVADGQYLLFTDADTVHAPGALRALVALALQRHASLVSAWPEQRMESIGEKLVVSLLPFVGALFYPHLLFALLEKHRFLRSLIPLGLRRAIGAANGQVILFERVAYRLVGGHEALRSHLVEDVALGRAVSARMDEGLWLVNCDGAGLIRCRMYRDFGEVWEGFTKNVRAAFEGEVGKFWCAGIAQAALFCVPFVLVCVPSIHREWAVVEVALVLALRALAVVGIGGAWSSVLLHPLAYGIALAIGLNSWRRSNGPGVRWKGRLYEVRHPGV